MLLVFYTAFTANAALAGKQSSYLCVYIHHFIIYFVHFFSLFAGVVPRVLWITLGGAFFFGFYDLTTRLLSGTDADS